MNKTMTKIIQWLVILVMPFFLGLGSIRLVIAAAPAYLTYEYNKPDFPADSFGFSTDQREELALVAVRYLQREEPAEEVIFMLEEQQLPDGSGPLYNAKEIGHMLDVKHVTDAVGTIWLVSAGLVLSGLAILLFQRDTRPAGYRAILGGGIATTVILLFIALFILLAWNIFFVQFHELLFPPETWTFRFDEALIRLFPEKFWFDIGVIMSMLPLTAGVLTTIVGYILVRRSAT